MDKQILEQYIDACVLVKETRAELEKLRSGRNRMLLKDQRMSFHTHCRRTGSRD